MVCQRDLRQAPGGEPNEGHCQSKRTEYRVAFCWILLFHLFPISFSHPLMGANPPGTDYTTFQNTIDDLATDKGGF